MSKKHTSYENYLNHQKTKTLNKAKIEKWLGAEWDLKLSGFKEIFDRNKEYIREKKNAICLGARTGQEVKALLDLGISAIGIDLVPFPPYTKEGDIHHLKYSNNSFDLVFTNIMDHSINPSQFCHEMQRVCKPEGIIIVQLQLGLNHDKYTEALYLSSQEVISLFNNVSVLENRKIQNSFDNMNREFILKVLE